MVDAYSWYFKMFLVTAKIKPVLLDLKQHQEHF